jgi:hypothetical protein
VGHLLSRLRRALVQHLPDQLLEQLLQCAPYGECRAVCGACRVSRVVCRVRRVRT